jgi:hypothetical protein
MRSFGQLFLKNKKYLSYIKQYLKSFLKKNFAQKLRNSVAMTTTTFQDGGYFGF